MREHMWTWIKVMVGMTEDGMNDITVEELTKKNWIQG